MTCASSKDCTDFAVLPEPGDSTNFGIALMAMLKTLHHELDVTKRLLKSNFVGFSFIFLGGLLSRMLLVPLPLSMTVVVTAETFALQLMCNYVFDICNQTSSPEEDYYNKPDRPIPSGKISLAQAKIRWVVAWTLSPLVLFKWYGVWAALHLLHWEILITVCYVYPRWHSWFMRNYFSSFSYCIMSRLLNVALAAHLAAWNIGLGIDLVIFAWFMGTIHIQEFHDLEGDRKTFRKTLPMLLVDGQLELLRAGTSLFIALFGLGLAYAAYRQEYSLSLGKLSVLQLTTSTIVAYRIWVYRTIAMDRITYHRYYYIAPLLILLSLVQMTA